MVLRALFLAMCMVSMVSCKDITEGKILRKRSRRPGPPQESCPLGGPNFYFTMIGEHTSPTGAFLVPDGSMPHHRHVGWSDEDIATYWTDASEFFRDYAGVDMTGIEVGEDGFKHKDGWSIISFTVYFGLRVPYTSERGILDCPIEVLDEGLALVPQEAGLMYHGRFGGEEGIEAIIGDVNPFGHYFIDMDQDDSTPHEVYHYEAQSPMRMGEFGRFFIDCNLFHERWGAGKNDGRFDFFTAGEDKMPHVSSRGIISFPPVWEL